MYHEIINDQLLMCLEIFSRKFVTRIVLRDSKEFNQRSEDLFVDRATIKFRIRFVQVYEEIHAILLPNNLFQALRDDQGDFLAAVENGKQSMKIVEYGRG